MDKKAAGHFCPAALQTCLAESSRPAPSFLLSTFFSITATIWPRIWVLPSFQSLPSLSIVFSDTLPVTRPLTLIHLSHFIVVSSPFPPSIPPPTLIFLPVSRLSADVAAHVNNISIISRKYVVLYRLLRRAPCYQSRRRRKIRKIQTTCQWCKEQT